MTPSRSPAPRISVVIASSGRPEGLAHLGRRLALQTCPPHRVVLSVTGPDDLPPAGHGYPDPIVLTGRRGLPGQRNRGLERVLPDSDLIAFFDDDYLPSHHALAGIAQFFDRPPRPCRRERPPRRRRHQLRGHPA